MSQKKLKFDLHSFANGLNETALMRIAIASAKAAKEVEDLLKRMEQATDKKDPKF